jgi:hypothetical protein
VAAAFAFLGIFISIYQVCRKANLCQAQTTQQYLLFCQCNVSLCTCTFPQCRHCVHCADTMSPAQLYRASVSGEVKRCQLCSALSISLML